MNSAGMLSQAKRMTGMVNLESPDTTVCYKSSPLLKCTFEEATDSAGWNMSTKEYKRFELNHGNELNSGSVVKLNSSCSTEEYKSCIAVTLEKVTGIWAGTYECGFTNGSVRHIAKTKLSVALLPDIIDLTTDPLTADCSENSKRNTDVTVSIPNGTESFDVWWSYMDKRNYLVYKSDGNRLVYTFNVNFCQDNKTVSVTFRNRRGQEKSAKVNIPVISDGKKVCQKDELNGDSWPKTPDGATVTIQTCAKGKVGNKSRSCYGSTWSDVVSNCISESLNNVLNEAESFQMGLGATQEKAKDIFKELKNISTLNSDSNDTTADITASINILTVMASASKNIELNEDIFPDFVDAASNLLDKTWAKNNSTLYSMSSRYLQSVENLVKNIKVNNGSNGTESRNLELRFCANSDCNVSVFDIGITLKNTTGILKTVAMKNLTDKLKNDIDGKEPIGLLISATLQPDNGSSLDIRFDFPTELNAIKPICVFWNITEKSWSGAGCTVKKSDGNRTLCECIHLTSFSVLLAKSTSNDSSNKHLETITSVGLGVSICSLLIFLIIESLVWSAVVRTNLSHFRHTAIVNIAVFLLLADCSFLVSSLLKSLSDTWCLVLTICKHLFYLAMFSWMLCMSVMLLHQLIFVFSPLRKRVFMFISSIVGYVCPILIVGSSYVYSKYTGKQYYDSESCWLVYDGLLEGSMYAFILPVGTVILTNLFSMVVVILTLLKSSASDSSKMDEKDTAKSILKAVVFLTPVFGVTWIVGFAQLILEKGSPMFHVASYSFTILNSFQGLLILLTGCFAEQKVREELLKLIMAKSKGKSESMKNLTSTTYTKDK